MLQMASFPDAVGESMYIATLACINEVLKILVRFSTVFVGLSVHDAVESTSIWSQSTLQGHP